MADAQGKPKAWVLEHRSVKKEKKKNKSSKIAETSWCLRKLVRSSARAGLKQKDQNESRFLGEGAGCLWPLNMHDAHICTIVTIHAWAQFLSHSLLLYWAASERVVGLVGAC